MRKAIESFQNFQLFVNRLLESNYWHWKNCAKDFSTRFPAAVGCSLQKSSGLFADRSRGRNAIGKRTTLSRNGRLMALAFKFQDLRQCKNEWG